MSAFTGPDFYALDESLSPQEQKLRDAVRSWVDEKVLPVIAECCRSGRFPIELVPDMARFGAFGATIKGYGCPGLKHLSYGLIMRELERGDSAIRTFASVQGALVMNAIQRYGSEEQKSRWLPLLARGEMIGCFGLTEPESGSDPGALRTKASKASGSYLLNGTKLWIGNGSIADVAVVWAKLEGIPGVQPEDPAAVRGFLVEKNSPGFSAEDIQGKLSLRASVTSRLKLENCRVPESALLPSTAGLKSALACLNQARFGLAWGAVGSAMACFEEARTHALQRIQFGKPIASFQLVQAKLANMLTEITKAQLLAYRLAQLAEAGRARHSHISMAKMNNVDMALNVARTARDMLGAAGILDSAQCFRHSTNLESVRTYEGTHDIHQLILGQEITGISAFG